MAHAERNYPTERRVAAVEKLLAMGYHWDGVSWTQASAAAKSFGVERIEAERRRQVEVEGWTAEHDGNHNDFDLPAAASAYAYFASLTAIRRESMRTREDPDDRSPQAWPWESNWWKPGADNSPAARIRELEKAGALIAAEIDRLAARTCSEGGEASPAVIEQGATSAAHQPEGFK